MLNSKTITAKQLAGLFDHTNLKAYATDEDFRVLCSEAAENGYAMVAINPGPVKLCRSFLEGTKVHVGAAISFPLGQTTVQEKVSETVHAILDGAQEIDYVINVGALKMGKTDLIRSEMEEIVKVCREHRVISKVIFEICYLTEEEIRTVAAIAKEVRPDFIKTSTGFGTGGATVEAVRIMKETVGDAVKVKAAGGIRDWKTCAAMIDAGAERIGTSSSGKILKEFMEEQAERIAQAKQTSRLFTTLPEEYVCTPDGMEIDRNGDLIVSCPNYADDNMSGCVIRIDREKHISKWFDVPVHPETGIARNMGAAFDRNYDLYLCDNQGWSGKKELQDKGRIIKVEFDENRQVKAWHTVAEGMEHPNGIRIRGDYMYVTQSYLTKVHSDEGLTSCVYRFKLDERDIHITNTLEDKHIFALFVTKNPVCVYGLDGIEIDLDGNLLVGNYGDAEVWKILLDENGDYQGRELYAKDPEELNSTDGMIMDKKTGKLYIADFNHNAIVCVDPDHRVHRLAQSPDTDGLHGELDQPGEPIIWNGKIIASCFDLVTDETKFNTSHEMPATMAELELE